MARRVRGSVAHVADACRTAATMGGCWLALQLWRELDLDEFWTERLLPSRMGTRWIEVLLILVVYRLHSPGSEWRLHREWYGGSALPDLLDSDEVIDDQHSTTATICCCGTMRCCLITWSRAGANCSTSASMCCSTTLPARTLRSPHRSRMKISGNLATRELLRQKNTRPSLSDPSPWKDWATAW